MFIVCPLKTSVWVKPSETNNEGSTDGARERARPLARWRLPCGPDSPPIDPIFGSGSRPQARIAGDPTFHCLVRFPRMLLAHSHCQVVWRACYIPPGKSLACFYDLRMHSYESARVAGGTLAPGRSSRTTKCEAPLFIGRAISNLRADLARSSSDYSRRLFLLLHRRAAQC
jgi:hypothetical protein